jgi:hypothetical protein
MKKKAFQAVAALLLLLATLLPSGQLFAHALAPSLLQLEELPDKTVNILWKTPQKKVPGSRLSPILPEECVHVGGATPSQEATGMLLRWQMTCDGLVGKRIEVRGIASSKADVLLRIELADGRHYTRVLTDDEPVFEVPAEQSTGEVVLEYVVLGVEHLLSGIDHVLFVVALTFLIGWNRLLFWTITCFTLGHSITLSMAILGFVTFPGQVAEIIIAFSIVLAAVELIRSVEKPGLFGRFPWLIAFVFGLLHGLGFAGALSEIGLPPGAIPLALFSFNIGIELGQLLVIVPFGLLLMGLSKRDINLDGWLRVVPGYVIGSVAAIWFWQRIDIVNLLGLY